MHRLGFNPNVLIKSLKYKCLSQVASMMKQSESELKSRPSYETPASTSEDPMPSTSSQIEPESAFHLPVSVVQLIIDHVIQEEIPIKFKVFCALMSNGGCFSLHLSKLRKISKFCMHEMTQIRNILARNFDHLHTLVIDKCDKLVYFTEKFCKDFTSDALRCLRCRINSLESLLDIFSAFPKLVELQVMCEVHSSTVTKQKLDDFFNDLQKPIYDQIRQSLQNLDISNFDLYPGFLEHISALFRLKLVSHFPNLKQLSIELNDHMLNTIKKVWESRHSNGIRKHSEIIIDSTELKSIIGIFYQLRKLSSSFYSPQDFDISSLFPNIQELGLVESNYQISRLKHLKSLSIVNSYELPNLPLFGDNLNYLFLGRFSEMDILHIARCCIYLKYFRVCMNFETFNQCAFDRLSMILSVQERELLKRPFRHLKTLNIVNCSDINLLSYILDNAVNIKTIQFHHCQISYEKLIKLTEKNPMKYLRFLHIEESNEHYSLSKHDFGKFINQFDELCYARCIKVEYNREEFEWNFL